MPDDTTPPPDGLDAVAGLGETSRRALYDFVVAAGDWVGRDAAANALGLERGTVAHHLDRLAADGLLEVEFRRLSGKTGPGAGRTAKLYRRARRDIRVNLPPRDYELASNLLAQAIERSRDGDDIDCSIDVVATNAGRRLADQIRPRFGRSSARGMAARREVVLEGLAEHGFEPHAEDDGTVLLRNCPFHQLAQAHTDLICGINHCMLRTALDELDGVGLQAELEPSPERCCVTLRERSERGGDPACWAHLDQ
jgi:predicted ArsR family transcriptional regulator